MKNAVCVLFTIVTAVGLAAAQSVPDTVDGHVAAAKAAAGGEYDALATRLCTAPAPPAPRPANAPAAPRPAGAPARDTWYAKPVKVFDNL